MRRLEKLKGESIKAGMGISWTGSVLCHTGFWRISACILLTGTKWNKIGDLCEISTNYHEWGKTQEGSNRRTLYKRNTEYLKNIPDQAHTGLGTDNHSRMWQEELGSQGLKQAIPEGPGGPEGPGPRPPPALPSTILALEKELYFILSTSGPQVKPLSLSPRLSLALETEKGLGHSPFMKASQKASLDQASPQHSSGFPFQLSPSVVLSTWQNYALLKKKTGPLWHTRP